jgi:long-chain acyl-CoA synthetase
MKLVGIYSRNRYEWFVTDWACAMLGITTVPLYDTLGVENISYCLNQTDLNTLFVTAATVNTLLSLKDLGKLRTLICYDELK